MPNAIPPRETIDLSDEPMMVCASAARNWHQRDTTWSTIRVAVPTTVKSLLNRLRVCKSHKSWMKNQYSYDSTTLHVGRLAQHKSGWASVRNVLLWKWAIDNRNKVKGMYSIVGPCWASVEIFRNMRRFNRCLWDGEFAPALLSCWLSATAVCVKNLNLKNVPISYYYLQQKNSLLLTEFGKNLKYY